MDTEEQIRQLFDNVLILWPLGVILVAVGAVKLVVWVWRERRLVRSGINDIDRMDGRTFEDYLRTAFVRLGYKVEVTKYRGDFGADLVVRKDGHRITVQAKRHSKNVGVKAVQEVVASNRAIQKRSTWRSARRRIGSPIRSGFQSL